MRRREFITFLGGAAAVWPLAARAQQQERMRRIGVLGGADDAEGHAQVTEFLRALAELGWIDGRNAQIDTRWGSGDANRIRMFAAELVSLKPDVIVVNSAPAIGALLRETHSVPIVSANASDLIGAGFVTNLAKPGGNLTGLLNFEFSIGGKWLELLKEIAPGVSRVAVVLNPDNPSTPGQLEAIQSVAPSRDVRVISMAVRDVKELHTALSTFPHDANDGLIVMPTVFNLLHRDELISFAAEHHIPAIYPFRSFAESGGLITYGVVVLDLFRRAASYVDRILKGEKPGDLPIQAPTKFELIINLKTAKALRLTVPIHLQQIADEVIE
jgi:ABC-type uncharacterized transport system substrate-binding protein